MDQRPPPPPNVLRPNYVCLFPHCELRFTDENLLDQHIKAHFSLESSIPLSPVESGESYRLGTRFSPVDTSCTYKDPLAATTDEATPSFVSPPGPNGQQAQNIIFDHWSPDGKSKENRINDSNKPFVCEHEECEKAFGRKGDLNRHMKSHQDGARAYNCLELKCPRKGDRGFYRLDKLKDHLDAKHPEKEVEKYWVRKPLSYLYQAAGYRDVSQRAEHEEAMRRKGYKTGAREAGFFIPLN